MKKQAFTLRALVTVSVFLLVSVLSFFHAPASSESRSLLPLTENGGLQAGSRTIEFRRGYDGYAGVADTFLDEREPDKALGSDQTLQAKEAWPLRRSLLMFDLISIPPEATITSAYLDLFVTYRSSTSASPFGFYYLLKPWDEAGATWKVTGLGQNWDSTGAAGAGKDFNPSAFASSPLSTVGVYNRVNVLTAVQHWVQYPDQNLGMLIMGNSAVDVRIWSSDDVRENERPRLIVTYEVQPTSTPRPTVSPTEGPSPTYGPSPTAANIIYSTGQREAFDDAADGTCTVATPDSPGNAEVLLVYTGTPLYAKLSFWYTSNNDRDHAIQVNGTEVGRLPGSNYRTKCAGTTLASRAVLDINPALLRSGINRITAVADRPGETDGWAMQYPRIELGGAVQGSQVQVVLLESSYDRTMQRAVIQKPAGYVPGAPVPLVLAFHGWGGRDFDALKPLADACSKRGWLLAAPDTRNSSEHTPSKSVQRDVLDLLQYMTSNPEYAVDTSRVYLIGNSMGGMMASVIGAKYPDRFAALAEIKGPSRLDRWYWEVEPWRRSVLYNEMNASPSTSPFSYERKSAALLASNLRYVPTLIIHGTQDTIVPYHHATDLHSAMMASGAVDVQLYSFAAGHFTDHPDWGSDQILGFFNGKVAASRPLTLTVRTDEPNTYYWLGIGYNTSDHWSTVRADFNPQNKTVFLDVHDERVPSALVYVTLDLNKMGLPTNVPYTVEDTNLATGEFRMYLVQAGQTLPLTVERDRHTLVVYPFVASAPQTLTFRQGEGGYQGMQDTYIETFDQAAIHGAEDRMNVTNDGNRTVLMRFDLSGVPSEMALKSAQLKVYTAYKWGSSPTLTVGVHGLLTDFDAAEANWLRAGAGAPWAKPGAWGADQDYAWAATSQGEMSDTFRWYSYNVTDLVRQWLAHPATNHGVLLRGSGGAASFQLVSSESSVVANRPALVLSYTQPTPTATSSYSATPTLVQTVTPSITPTSGPKNNRAYLPMITR